MAQVWQHSRLWLAETVFIGSALSLLASPTLAQIVPDNSLGAESSRLTPNSNVRGQAADRIDGGALRGANLFHSFSDFNVNNGQRVYFSNPIGVNNILSRVTGTNLSNISGTLGVDGGANLFLLNPNGIIFGPNARLDISGSFVSSTADRFAFPNGGEFSATNPQAPPLLTVSLPLGLQYGQGDITRGDIVSRGTLTVGQDLALFGNRLDLQGQLQAGRDLTLQAQEIVQARDSQADPFIASAGRNLSIQGTQGIDILALSHPQSQILSGGNLSLIGDGTISGDAHFASGGDFSLGSASGGLANFVSLYDPIISATGNVDLAANYSGASLLVESQGNVRVQGTVDVTAPDTISSFVGSDTVLGTQPGLIVRSGQSSLVYGGTNQNSPPAFTGGVIPEGVTLVGVVTTAGGPVRVDAATGNVNTSSISTQGGELRLNAAERDITTIGTLSTSNGALDGGAIEIQAGRDITAGNIDSSSSPNSSSDSYSPDVDSYSYSAVPVTSGNGGAIEIRAGRDITAGNIDSSSSPNSSSDSYSPDVDSYSYSAVPVTSGNGGAIEIRAGRDITAGNIDSSSSSSFANSGNGGAIEIRAGRDITADNIGSFSSLGSSRSYSLGSSISYLLFPVVTSGNGGAIEIRAGRDITAGNIDSSSSSGSARSYPEVPLTSGNGGAIEIRAGRDITVGNIDSSSSSNVDSGNGGAIEFSAGRDITAGNIDSSSSSGPSKSFLEVKAPVTPGNGGAIEFSAGRDITTQNIDSSSYLSLYSPLDVPITSGNGGAIEFSAGRDITTRNIDSSSSSNPYNFPFRVPVISGNGGAIEFSAGRDITTRNIDSSSSSSFADSGNGGAIEFSAGRDITTRNIDSSSSPSFADSGNGGAIEIRAGRDITADAIRSSSSSFPPDSYGNFGNGGAIEIRAGRDITADAINSSSSSGNAGAIEIRVGRDITAEYIDSVSSSSYRNSGNGGATEIRAGRDITVDAIQSFSYSYGNSGNGGAIEIRAGRDITTQNIDSYSISRFGDSGNGGAIEFSAGRDIAFIVYGVYSVQGISSFSYSGNGDAGNGGAISISVEGDITDKDTVRLHSFSASRVGSSGSGGSVTLNVQNAIRNLEILTLSSSSNSGAVRFNASGDLSITNTRIITSRQVSIENPGGGNSDITLSIGAQGQSGNVTVTTPGNLTFNHSSIQSDTKGSDPAGDITITSSGQITFNNSEIISNTSSTGRAGSITVEADRLFLNNSELTSDTRSGGGGNIRLQGLDLLKMQDSLISTAASESAGGGNISINTTDTPRGFVLGSNNSDIVATAVGGAGGQIDIYADGVLGFIEQSEPNLEVLRSNSTNDISASSASGPQGIVNISARLDPTQGIVELPNDLVDASNLVTQSCAAGGVTTASDLSEFIISGRGGLSSSPTERLSDNTAVPNWIMLDSEVVPAVPAAASTIPQPVDAPIVEAQGWSIDSNGEVVLIADAPTVTPQPAALGQASCNAARN